MRREATNRHPVEHAEALAVVARLEALYAAEWRVETCREWAEQIRLWGVDRDTLNEAVARMVSTERFPTLAALKTAIDSVDPANRHPSHRLLTDTSQRPAQKVDVRQLLRNTIVSLEDRRQRAGGK